MESDIFTHEDLAQIKAHGLTLEEVERQLELFKGPPPHLNLQRPCTPGDGIKLLNEEEVETFIRLYAEEGPGRLCMKFVPASGAASRMFRSLLRFHTLDREIIIDDLRRRAEEGDGDAENILEFSSGLSKFAFYQDLAAAMSKEGLDMESLLKEGRLTQILHYLLTEAGLNYGNLPKGLLKFHAYPEGSRTAFEEHLVEAASYVADEKGECHLHLTVSAGHLSRFEQLLEEVRDDYESRYRVKYRVTFSIQKKSTDTIAVDLENRPFRDEDGRLLFRPGGHGALIENLNDLDADLVFIKNIDNVVPDRLKPETFRWKKALGGYLIHLQKKVFNYLDALLSGSPQQSVTEEALSFVKSELFLPIPPALEGRDAKEKARFLIELLNRPMRVCGMVRNVGEPGGGPFWVSGGTGRSSPQIVEKAQVDSQSEQQMAIWNYSTHFNPVDLVCGIRDWQGRSFDLRHYVDPAAVFISQKSKGGKDLKALEHPGLWNGAMAGWISVFVDVPLVTFNPVKTVNNLLRKEHQGE